MAKERDYSRTEYVFGKDALLRMQNSHYLILGLGGVGFEVCKNIILTGAAKVSVYDNNPVCWSDISANGFLTESSIGQRKDIAQGSHYAELNPQCQYDVVADSGSVMALLESKKLSCVIITESAYMNVNGVDILYYCHHNGINVVLSTAIGLAGRLFSDFGKGFVVVDTDGEKVEDASVSYFSADFIDGKVHYYITTTGNHGLDEKNIINIRDMVLRGTDAESTAAADRLNQLMDNVEFEAEKTTYNIFEMIPSEEKTKPELIEALKEIFALPSSIGAKIVYERGGYIRRVKQPRVMDFESFDKASVSPTYPEQMLDFVKMTRNPFLHSLFIANDKCKECSFDDFLKYARDFSFYNNIIEKEEWEDKENLEVAAAFYATRTGVFSSVCSIVGGWGAQEALKSVSGKYTPIQQFFYFDAFETLKVNKLAISRTECLIRKEKQQKEIIEEFAPKNDRYDGIRIIFGNTVLEEIHNSSIFMIGAGALGCELLKNFALCGVATAENSMFTVTDPDSIENSNLSRQFLFRESNIGQFKSQAACDRIAEMNSEMNTHALQLKVCPETENVFNRKFWTSNTLIVNALDNVKSRRYVDGKCVEFFKPLLESGTMGQKANSQVIIPKMTETYSAQIDSEEGEIPQCVIHNFPNTLAHCIVYANSEFAGTYFKSATDLSRVVKSEEDFDSVVSSMIDDESSVKGRLTGLAELCAVGPIKSYKDAIKWAVIMFFRNFNSTVEYILQCFPIDSKDKDGHPFWSSEKRPPHVLKNINPENDLHKTFLFSAAKLISVVWGLPEYSTMDYSEFIERPEINDEINNILMTEQYNQSYIDSVTATASHLVKDIFNKYVDHQLEVIQAENPSFTRSNCIKKLIGSICPYNLDSNTVIKAFELEKDDPENAHIEYIGAFANLRAENYRIPQSGIDEVRRIAGNIVPAMITTTALIVGYVGIEFVKAMTYKRNIFEIGDYKSVYVNFAIPSTIVSEPGEYKKKVISTTGEDLTEWDFVDIDLSDNSPQKKTYTLEMLKNMYEEKYKCVIDMFATGSSMVYSEFNDDAMDILPTPLIDIIDANVLSKLNEKDKEAFDTVIITVGGYDPENDFAETEFELPKVRVLLK